MFDDKVYCLICGEEVKQNDLAYVERFEYGTIIVHAHCKEAEDN